MQKSALAALNLKRVLVFLLSALAMVYYHFHQLKNSSVARVPASVEAAPHNAETSE